MTDNDNTGGAFVQPSLNDERPVHTESGELVLRDITPGAPINSGKTDELSVALADSKKPLVAAPEPEKAKGKYALDYSLKGEAIHETHSTVRSALARIAALGRLGIVPATSTNV